MWSVGIRYLKQHTSEVLRHVQETGEVVVITHRGRAVARLVPVEDERSRRGVVAAVWTEMDDLAREIGARWPTGVSSIDAVGEQRREL